MARASSRGIVWIILLIILLILLYLWWRSRQEPDDPPPQDPLSAVQYASGWVVKNNADWTPFPPNSNPLGAPDDHCTGGSIPGSWAEFAFPAFSLPAGATVTGIEVRMKYLSQSGSNTLRLIKSGSLVGSNQTQAMMPGTANCASTTWGGTGGDGNLWGATVTAADFNAGNIGVRLTQNANTVNIDAVELKVYYAP